MKECPWAVNLTCSLNKGVGALSSVSAFNHVRAPTFVYVHQAQGAASGKRACIRALPAHIHLKTFTNALHCLSHKARLRLAQRVGASLRVNFNPIQEIEPKVGGGRSFARVQCIPIGPDPPPVLGLMSHQ